MSDKDMIEMYNLVFRDMVKCYLEDYEDEDYEDLGIKKEDITDSVINEVAYRLIYKSEYLWETINDHINMYLENYFRKDVE